MPDPCGIPEHAVAIHNGECWECDRESRRAEAVAEFLSYYPNQILNLLRDEGMGIQGLEAKADPSKIPAAILQAVPDGFKDGSKVSGFGLGGGTGIGKTQAVASLLRVALSRYAERVIVPSIKSRWDARERFPSVCWSSWPDEVHWLRANALGGAEDRVDRLATARLLVLDDLGRERIKGDYSQDWGASQLDYIVNTRYRAELPTIWTTNVRQADLVRLYGAAMVRRLIEPNPLVWVEGLKPFNIPRRLA